MKVELTADDMRNILVALQSIQITGKDAPVIVALMDKVGKAFEKAVEKESKTESK